MVSGPMQGRVGNQLVQVVLHLTAKEISKFTAKTGEMAVSLRTFLYLQSFSTNHGSWFEHTDQLSSNN